jgi:hypothetical protein
VTQLGKFCNAAVSDAAQFFRVAKHTDKRKGRPEAAIRISLGKQEKIGAGKGIRTLDPNLGKVVLYP